MKSMVFDNMDRLKQQLIATLFALITPTVFAGTFGIELTPVITSADPEHVHGGQVMLAYDPQYTIWGPLTVYFDGGYSFFTAPKSHHHHHIGIISVAPVLRLHLKQYGAFKPYIDGSVGPSYMNQTRFENHNLGLYFAFQDRIGAGVVMGRREQFSLGVSAIHYSNANISNRNTGITIPLMMNLTFNFV